jgi:hypothetical protein
LTLSSSRATSAWQQGTSATNLAFMAQAEQEGFVGGGVAGMQSGDDIHRAHISFRDFAMTRIPCGRRLLSSGDFRAVSIRSARASTPIYPAPPCGCEIQIVENKTQIGLARAQIGQ